MSSGMSRDEINMNPIMDPSARGMLLNTEDKGFPIQGKKTRTLHFGDGSTMEVDNDQESDETDEGLVGEERVTRGVAFEALQNPAAAAVDPKSLSWPDWVKHYSHKSGSSVLGGLESAGETLAYYLGITTPKYQHEIDEYNRMVSKKKAEAEEAKAWASTNPSAVPIVTDVVKPDILTSSTPFADEKHSNRLV